MKTYRVILCALGISAIVIPAHASTLYGSTSAGGPGELWILDASTGAAVQDVGPLNDSSAHNYAVTGLAFNPLDGVLYGSTGGTSGHSLLTINPASGAVTVIGSFNVGGVGGTMSDLSFDSSGHLFGISASGGANLYSIDLGTGQATEVGASGVSFTAGGGLGISPEGTFFGTPTTSQFGTFDPITGTYSNITNPAKPAGSSASYASLAFDGDTLYGMNLGTTPHLVTFDSLGNVTDIGPSVPKIDGIAFLEPVPEPTTMAIFLGAGVMVLAGSVRRRKQ